AEAALAARGRREGLELLVHLLAGLLRKSLSLRVAAVGLRGVPLRDERVDAEEPLVAVRRGRRAGPRRALRRRLRPRPPRLRRGRAAARPEARREGGGEGGAGREGSGPAHGARPWTPRPGEFFPAAAPSAPSAPSAPGAPRPPPAGAS